MAEPTQGGETSFSRGVRVVLAFAGGATRTVPDLAQELNLPRSTVYRYLRQLRQFGLIEELEVGRYVAGPAFLGIALGRPFHEQLRVHGEETLRELAAETGETAILTVRVDSTALVVAQVESSRAVRLSFTPGSLHPLHAGASASVLLAFESDAVIERIVTGPLTRFTDRTIVSSNALRHRNAEVRRAGFISSTGEVDPEATAVAAPVFHTGRLLCGLSVAAPSARLGEDQIPIVAEQVMAAARRLEHALTSRRERHDDR
jgi:DNA-binding IclR family transcriptional regulator